MKIAITAPSPIPFSIGGAENIYSGLFHAINQTTQHQAELIKIAVKENSFWGLLEAYARFSSLNLLHFDAVISLKYPAWMVQHPRHVVYMQHKLRGLYDTYGLSRLPTALKTDNPALADFVGFLSETDPSESSRDESIILVMNWLERLSAKIPPNDPIWHFPGPLIRKVIHFLDSVALQPQRICSFNAISHTVARRPLYFPDGVNVAVRYHPTTLSVRHGDSIGKYFFTVSRLERAKRIDLLIESFKQSDVPYDFLIAGAGPDQAYFESVASGDHRIKFIGRLSDAQLIEAYAGSLAVLFAPYDEDFGLIALEAMASGKPVLTTTDAGGPTELVENAVSGLICTPTTDALANAINSLGKDPSLAVHLGINAREKVKGISWRGLVEGLLGTIERSEGGGRSPKSTRSSIRRRAPRKGILAISSYGGRAQTGGPLRIRHLYRRLSTQYDVTLLVLSRNEIGNVDICPGYREVYVPMTSEYIRREAQLHELVPGVPIADLAFPLISNSATSFIDAIKHLEKSSEILLLEHPYLFPAISNIRNLNRRLIVDEHNIEVLLKRDILPYTRPACELLSVVHSVEFEAVHASRLTLTCSDEDKDILSLYFGLNPERIHVVPNGVDCQSTRYTPLNERPMRQKQLGMRECVKLAYFLGSWHGPNIEAAQRIIEAARMLPSITFLIAGSVGAALRSLGIRPPSNAVVSGHITHRCNQEILGICSLALNPMASGSGTNLKLLEYAASGAPIYSSHIGLRGSGLVDNLHVQSSLLAHMEEAIVSALSFPDDLMNLRLQAARRLMESTYDWELISSNLLSLIKEDFSYDHV